MEESTRQMRSMLTFEIASLRLMPTPSEMRSWRSSETCCCTSGCTGGPFRRSREPGGGCAPARRQLRPRGLRRGRARR
eukprot:3371035-Heterocapsa_arctica.AAC.1